MLSGVEYNSYYDFENQHTFPSLSGFDSNRRENGDPSTKYESSRDGDTLTKNTRAPEPKIASTNKMATVTEIPLQKIRELQSQRSPRQIRWPQWRRSPYKNTRASETKIPLQKYESFRDGDPLTKIRELQRRRSPYKNTRASETEIPLQKYESFRDGDTLDKCDGSRDGDTLTKYENSRDEDPLTKIRWSEKWRYSWRNTMVE
jgi:DNA primase